MGLAAADPALATSFYTSLFGWDSEELGGRGRDVHDPAPRRQGGRDPLPADAAGPRGGGVAPLDLLRLGRGRRCNRGPSGELGGAAVFRQSFDVLDAGRVAAIRDPTGAIVSLWQPRSLIGAALVNDVGAWC